MLDRRHFPSTAAAGVAILSSTLAFRGNLLAQIEKAPLLYPARIE